MTPKANAAGAEKRGRRRKGTQRKLDHLLAKAASLIAEKGYEATAIRDVGREVGASLAGMYYYFDSKEELLYQIQHRTFASLLETQEKVAAEPGTPEERFRRLLRGHLAFFGSHPDEMRVCTYELESLTGDRAHAVEELRRQYYHLMTDVVGELLAEGGSRRRTAQRTRHFTMFVFGMLNWVFTWHDAGRDPPVDNLDEDMLDLVLDGLRRTRGSDNNGAPTARRRAAGIRRGK